MSSPPSIAKQVKRAVQEFWKTRDSQSNRQRGAGRTDQGARGAVTGGKQMDGFTALVRSWLIGGGVPASAIQTESRLELPGYFRAEKKWDLLVVENQTVIAALEFKSQIGPSFGNNLNNRSEEAIGTAHDLWTAYREGALSPSPRPWLGYLMLLEDCERSTAPVAVREPHFPVLPEFVEASYVERYRQLLKKLVRERLYDAACFLTSVKATGLQGRYQEPDVELSIDRWHAAISGMIAAYRASRELS